MYKFENIFVPVDFSSASTNALKVGQSLLATGGQMHVTHVLPRLPDHVRAALFPYAPLGEDEPEFEWELLKIAQDRIEVFHKFDGIDVQLGEPRALLPDLIRRSAAELIVMGAFGEGASYPDGLGALTERILRAGRQPVMVAREPQAKQISSILVATDLTSVSGAVISAALAVAFATDASIETLHVLPDPLDDDLHGFLRGQIKFDRRQAVTRSRDKIDALFEHIQDGLDIPFPIKDRVSKLLGKRRIHAGDPSQEILDRAQASEVDLIVVGGQRLDDTGRLRLGTVAQKVARRASCHVLVVPVDPIPEAAQET